MGNPVAFTTLLSAKYLQQNWFERAEYVPYSYEEAAICADHYEDMEHTPDQPEVAESYRHLRTHLINQFKLLQNTGFQIINGKGEHNYPNSEALRDDMRMGRIIYLPTYANNGTNSEMPSDHPFAETVELGGRELLLNDVFRVVHDFYAHGAGHDFSPRGEHEAWNTHRKLLPRSAHLALWCETRAQSSWVNFGRHIREAEERIPPAQRPYAAQKSGIPPQHLI